MHHRISPATSISLVALFFSVTGVGVAATGFRITSIFQIAPRVRQELRGATGPRGAAGAQGAPGATGAQGPAGPQGLQGTQASSQFDGLTFPGQPTSVGAGQQSTLTALCPGDDALSGGDQITPGLEVVADQAVTRDEGLPYPRPIGWEITVENPTSGALQATVNVNCGT